MNPWTHKSDLEELSCPSEAFTRGLIRGLRKSVVETETNTALEIARNLILAGVEAEVAAEAADLPRHGLTTSRGGKGVKGLEQTVRKILEKGDLEGKIIGAECDFTEWKRFLQSKNKGDDPGRAAALLKVARNMARKGMRVITFTDPNPVSVDPSPRFIGQLDPESLDSPCGELSVAEAKKFFMKGLRQGLRKGLSKKKSRIKPRKKREIARRLLAAGVEPQVIAEAAGLSRYELTALELEKVFGIEQNDSLMDPNAKQLRAELEGEVTSEFFELLSFARSPQLRVNHGGKRTPRRAHKDTVPVSRRSPDNASLQAELGRELDMEVVKKQVKEAFVEVFGIEYM
ncbi:MAG: hypothetical protein AAF471_04510 [Myxococcota bacterium]